jgi:hypothetical protein
LVSADSAAQVAAGSRPQVPNGAHEYELQMAQPILWPHLL